MKDAALAVHLLVCGGDLVKLHVLQCVARVCVCASVSSMFPHPCFLFPLIFIFVSATVFFLLPAHMCWCASPHECVTAVVCLLTFALLSPFTRRRHLLWPWMRLLLFFLPFLSFFKRQFQKKSNRKEELNKVKKRNNICLKNWENSHQNAEPLPVCRIPINIQPLKRMHHRQLLKHTVGASSLPFFFPSICWSSSLFSFSF